MTTSINYADEFPPAPMARQSRGKALVQSCERAEFYNIRKHNAAQRGKASAQFQEIMG